MSIAASGRAARGRLLYEWPTWVMLVISHLGWLALIYAAAEFSTLLFLLAAIPVALHSSLQHEILHGHPTRNALVNEALVSLPLGLFIPYRRFRDLHLQHHNDERLTDPYDDPESFYLHPQAWSRFPGVMQTLICFNGTFAGRMLVGPALAMWAFWRTEARLFAEDMPRVRGAWLRHLAGLAVLIPFIVWLGVPLWAYVLMTAYPALSLIMVRSFIEHRAADAVGERTVIVESCAFWRLLFLNNNFHAVHHRHPTTPWYRLQDMWQTEREDVLRGNAGYLFRGYGAVMRHWLLRRREPAVHPFLHGPGSDPQ